MQDRGVQIMHMDLVLHRVETKLVGPSVNDSRLDAAARHPNRVAVWMMVPADLTMIAQSSAITVQCPFGVVRCRFLRPAQLPGGFANPSAHPNLFGPGQHPPRLLPAGLPFQQR